MRLDEVEGKEGELTTTQPINFQKQEQAQNLESVHCA